MEFKLRGNQGYYRTLCICGESFRPGDAAVDLYENETMITSICPGCLEAGPNGIKKRILKSAEYHRNMAEWLEFQPRHFR